MRVKTVPSLLEVRCIETLCIRQPEHGRPDFEISGWGNLMNDILTTGRKRMHQKRQDCAGGAMDSEPERARVEMI